MKTHPFSRRMFLRGVGVTMALPWLESLPVWGDEAGAGRKPGSQAPVRLAVPVLGQRLSQQGVVGKGRRKADGARPGARAADRLPREAALHPRALQRGGSEGKHPQLTDRQPAFRGAACLRRRNSLGHQHRSVRGSAPRADRPRSPSLVLGCERSNPVGSTRTIRCFTARTSHGALRPLRRRWNCIRPSPSTGCSRTKSNAATRACSTRCSPRRIGLRRNISATDQRKLDEYLDSVREVEQRIEQAGKKGELQGWRPTLDQPDMPRPPDGIPQDIAEHMRLMCDILVLGFQTDTTRVCTLKLNNDHSYLRFPHLNVDYMITTSCRTATMPTG